MQRRHSIKLFFTCLVTVILVWSVTTARGIAAPYYIIKFASVAPDGSVWIKAMKNLDKEIREKSSGQLGLRIYAGGIAGDELDILKKIRIGQIHCTGFSGVGFGQILPMVRVLDLPFLFNNDDEVDRVLQEMQPFFADQFRKKGFEFLSWAEVGNVYLFSKKPVQKVEDLSGLKVWIWAGDPIAKETFTALGVNPIPLAVTDVTTALSTGMIDTVYATPVAALSLQWHTSLDYVLDLPIAHSTAAVLISKKYYQKLPKYLADLLSKGTEKHMDALTLELRKQNQEAIRVIQQSGVTITPAPTGDDLEKFHKVHGQVVKNLTGDIFPKEVLEKVYEYMGRNPDPQ